MSGIVNEGRIFLKNKYEKPSLKPGKIAHLSFKEKLEQIPKLSGNSSRHYLSPTIQGIITGIGQIDI